MRPITGPCRTTTRSIRGQWSRSRRSEVRAQGPNREPQPREVRMIRALFTAATGMEAQQLKIDNIANNLANVNTVGYKKSRENFEDLMYQNIKLPGKMTTDQTRAPVGIQIGHGTRA